MKCPRCNNITLLMAEKQNVEIDYCPECRGIWLDSGKFDRIVERMSVGMPQQDRSYNNRERVYHDDDDDHDRYDHDDDHNRSFGDKRGYRKKSFLKDLFDF